MTLPGGSLKQCERRLFVLIHDYAVGKKCAQIVYGVGITLASGFFE